MIIYNWCENNLGCFMPSLCDLTKKDIEKNFKKIIKSVNDPKYFCIKCARVSNEKNNLCKPIDIKTA